MEPVCQVTFKKFEIVQILDNLGVNDIIKLSHYINIYLVVFNHFEGIIDSHKVAQILEETLDTFHPGSPNGNILQSYRSTWS